MSSDEVQKIRATIVLEIIGKPAEHLTKSLEELIKNLGEEKGVKVKDKKIHKPTPMKEKKDFFTSFAEIDIEVEDTIVLLLLMFKYMPAHVEIVSPEKLILKNNDLSGMLNELIRRLHGYDQVARVIQAEKRILEAKLKDIIDKIKEAKEKAEKDKKKK